MKRTKMIAVAVGAAALLGFGGTAMAASLDDDPRATTGLGASPSSPASASASTFVDDSAMPSSSRSSDDSGASASASSSSMQDVAGAAVSREEAVAIAQAYLGQGSVREVESDDVRNVPVWKVEFTTDSGRREINVEKATGTVISDEFDDRSGSGHGSDDNSGHGRNGDD
ncbi:PepSY domain-containing protein [Catenuloplanes sp. NPDC051500]|uniref:PepSY domain-containing protein n=1 Tax=Catenuloplanes sp. NPDC051500 TaxID=3363959 RepID=UPI0037BA27BE